MAARSARDPGRPVDLMAMTTTRRTVLGLLGLLGAAPLAAGGALAPAGPAAAAGEPDVRELDRLVADLAAKDEFSGGLLLTRRGRTVLARSYGTADRARRVPIGPDTRFALASVTKLFTAVAVAQLAQRGMVAYGERIGAYVPGLAPAVAAGVTVHHLLTHTSGLGDYHDTPGFWARAAGWTSAEQVMDGITEIIRPAVPAFAPGAGNQYSNAGYHLLGVLVAQVSGRSYHDYVREHVLRPAGMRDSDFLTRPQRLADPSVARPYTTLPSGERVDNIENTLFIGTPAGDAYATCADLDRFGRALTGARLLDPVFSELTLAGKVPLPPPPPAPGLPPAPPALQAYGPIAALLNGVWAVGHGGGSPGASTSLETFPQRDWAVTVLSNYDAGTVLPIVRRSRLLITA
jgi:CubicO group peptidase (beta-lactamase class C family)